MNEIDRLRGAIARAPKGDPEREKKRKRFEQEVIDDLMSDLQPPSQLEKPSTPNGKTEVVELYPPPLTEEQLMRRQQAIDATWWQHLRWEAEQRGNGLTTCHKGPGDSDWDR